MKKCIAVIVCVWSSLAFANDPRPILVVVGMKMEADLINIPNAVVVVSAGDVNLLLQRLKPYSAANVRAVISFGVAGGLDPSLRPGQLLLAKKVTDGEWDWRTSKCLRTILKAKLKTITPLEAREAGIDTLSAVDPASRAELRSQTGAASVDNESQIAARFAGAENLPFAVVRAVSDPASYTFPPAAMLPLLPDGTPDMTAIQASIQKDPSQIQALIDLNNDNQAALATLKQAVPVMSEL